MKKSDLDKSNGIAFIESTMILGLLLSLLFPAIGLLDLLIAKHQLSAVSSSLVQNLDIKSFRLFSGDVGWFTRPIDGANERNSNSNQGNRIEAYTLRYNQALSDLASFAESEIKKILGSNCSSRDCTNAYRVEVRVVVPYIIHDTAELIRIVCARNERNSDSEACPMGRASDLTQDIEDHRFLRIHGKLLNSNTDLLDTLMSRARNPDLLKAYAIPSGSFKARYKQNYGSQDYSNQHGYSPEDGRELTPDYLRHVMLIGVQVAVDLEGTPAGTLLKMTRSLGDANSPPTVLKSLAVGIPRQEF